jgi:hypothetical protein
VVSCLFGEFFFPRMKPGIRRAGGSRDSQPEVQGVNAHPNCETVILSDVAAWRGVCGFGQPLGLSVGHEKHCKSR